MVHAAALGTDLHHAAVFAGGGDHLLAFENVVAGGFFDVDVFAGLAGPDGGQRVPVVGERHGNGLHLFIVENLAHVGVAFGFLAGGLFDLGLAAFARGLIDVAEGDDVGLGQFRVQVHMIASASTEADDGDVDFVVGGDEWLRLGGGDRRGGGEGEESASGVFG